MNVRKQEEDVLRRRRRLQRLESSNDTSSRKTVTGYSGVQQPSQKNAVTMTGSPISATPRRPPTQPTAFAHSYGRLGFPLAAVHGVVDGQRLRWLVPPEQVDYDAYLPVLADGLRERPRPYGACAAYDLWELLARDCSGERVLSALPRTVLPVRRALDVGRADWPTTVRALKSLQKLTSAGRDGLVGPALVAYYRQLLPPINRYQLSAGACVTATDGLDSKVTYNLTDLCHETLCLLERTGGECAYVNIKSVIPTYQSCTPAIEHKAAGDRNSIDVRCKVFR